jgi:hypothetical protein
MSMIFSLIIGEQDGVPSIAAAYAEVGGRGSLTERLIDAVTDALEAQINAIKDDESVRYNLVAFDAAKQNGAQKR